MMPKKNLQNRANAQGEEIDYINRRDTPRRSVLWPAVIHLVNHEFRCQIRNFSMGGLKLRFDIPLRDGTVLEIEIPRLDVKLRAQVAWQIDQTMGILFLEDPKDINVIFGESNPITGVESPGPKKAFSGALIP